jgi:hypothetical protein
MQVRCPVQSFALKAAFMTSKGGACSATLVQRVVFFRRCRSLYVGTGCDAGAADAAAAAAARPMIMYETTKRTGWVINELLSFVMLSLRVCVCVCGLAGCRRRGWSMHAVGTACSYRESNNKAVVCRGVEQCMGKDAWQREKLMVVMAPCCSHVIIPRRVFEVKEVLRDTQS